MRRSEIGSLRRLSALAGFGVVLGSFAYGQGFPAVPGNLEQQSVSTGKKQLPPVSVVQPLPEDFENLRLGLGFMIKMEVFEAPEMEISLRVDDQGDLIIPLLGRVHLAGLTIGDAQTKIEQAYISAQILRAPQVTLSISQYSTTNTSVLGEVQVPGRIPLLGPKSLSDVLALAGGETLAAGSEIDVASSKGVEPRHIEYVPNSDPEKLRKEIIHPGDVVFVRRADTVYVLGAVNRPGGYLMVHGGKLNVLEAVSLAFGTTQIANTKEIRIVRPLPGGQYLDIVVPYKEITRGDRPPTPLMPNDIIYIPTNGLKDFFLNGSSIISAAGSAAIYKF